MFALVKTQICGAASPYKRLIRRFSATDGIYFELSKEFGVRAIECTIDMYQNESLRRSEAKADRAFNLLTANKIRSVVPSEDFPFSELIKRNQLTVPESKTLWAKTAGQIASIILSQGNESMSVAIYTNKVGSELDDAVRYLLPLTSRLVICSRGNVELYIRGLLREFGISVLTSFSALASADVHLMLQRPPILPPVVKSTAIAIQFYNDEYNLPCRSVKDIEYSWPDRIKSQQEYPADILLTALNEAGAIRPEDLFVKNIVLSAD